MSNFEQRLQAKIDELSEILYEGQENGESDIKSWALLQLREKDDDKVSCGGCICPSCMANIAILAIAHAKMIAREHEEGVNIKRPN